MAWVTGTAANHRDLLRKLVAFLTTNASLVAASQVWTINRGYVDNTVDYIQNTTYEVSTDFSWDVSAAMGLEDAYAEPTIHQFYGWVDNTTNLPNGYLGVKFDTAKTPTSYDLRIREWSGTSEGDQMVKDWDIEYSDNGITWTTAEQVRNQLLWTYGETKTYTIGAYGAHTYWRLRPIANNGDATYVSIGRLRFKDAGGVWISRAYTPAYCLKGRGLSGTEEIFLNLRLHQNIPSDWFTLAGQISTGYDASASVFNQPNGYLSYTPLWDDAMTYWFIANGQRVIVVAKVSTVYEMSYYGKYLPYALPGQYPYPVISSGPTASVSRRWSDVTPNHRTLQAPGHGSALLAVGNQWVQIQDRYDSSGDTTRSVSTAGYAHLTPVAEQVYTPYTYTNQFLSKNPDGTYNLFPYVIFSLNAVGGSQVFGELDGVLWVTGNSNSSETIITVAGQDHLVVQNAFRTGDKDYCAVELK